MFLEDKSFNCLLSSTPRIELKYYNRAAECVKVAYLSR